MSKLSKEKMKAMIAKNLKDARQGFHPKLTQEDVAQLFTPPLTRAAIAQWEMGDTLPDIVRMTVLSKAYGRTIDSLIFGFDKPADDELPPEAMRLARSWLKLTREHRTAVMSLVLSLIA